MNVIYFSLLLTNTLAIEDFPSSAPRRSVALTSNPYTLPASRAKLAMERTWPETGSIAKRCDSSSDARPRIW